MSLLRPSMHWFKIEHHQLDSSFDQRNTKYKRRSFGFIKRYCQHSWFTDFDFISYSTSQDGLYSTACVLFHTETQTEQPSVLVYKPYTNWKKLYSLICKITVGLESHRISKAKMDAFVSTYIQPSSKISFILSTTGNRNCRKEQKDSLPQLWSVLNSVVCRRVALRGHRDDSTVPDKRQPGNFKWSTWLPCIDAGDQVL